jgi:hypothetical protein
MLIFENLYLLLGKPKNGKCELFGNLEKRSMHWSHKVLGVYRCFLMSLFKLKSASKNAYNLTRAIFRVWEVQK